MNLEHWREVENIYQSAIDLEADSRGAYLDKVCKGDAALRREVELLIELDSLPQFIDQPAWNIAPELLEDDVEIAPGTDLGPYRVETLLGAGGMGKVYRAIDTRLGRPVAVKLSRIEFSKRFEQEARAIATLNHPNICTLYDVGPNFLVMELVEGITLSDRIAQGQIPLDEALDISRQIIAALAAAHEKGIVHRDLKPGNIKIKPEGSIKVLDFGLAKLGGTPTIHIGESPTFTTMSTQAGMILGTAAYVSPEQARGKEVDKRADIWAFGVVLYEMLTGRQPFARETVPDILAAVLKEEPQWNDSPYRVQRLLQSCLQKNPDHRLRDIGDATLLLQETPQTVTRTQPWFAWGAAVVLLPALVWLAFVHFREVPPEPLETVRFELQLPGLTEPPAFAISPDGKKLVFVATGADGIKRLWIRALDNVQARPLQGSETTRSGVWHVPFWSPESRFIAFDAGGKLKTVDLLNGAVRTICIVTSRIAGGSWNKDGVIIFGVDDLGRGIMRVSATGGEPSPVTTAVSEVNHQPIRHLFPTFLPDGKHFIFRHNGPPDGVYIASIDGRPDQREVRVLQSDPNYFSYASTDSRRGLILFTRDGTLFAQRFDHESRQQSGEAAPIAENVYPADTDIERSHFSVSNTGVLVHTTSSRGRTLAWLDRQGKVLDDLGESAQMVALSPDATRVAFSRLAGPKNQALWLMDLMTAQTTQLTFNPGREMNPIWSWDGRRIAFVLYRRDGPGFNIRQITASGASTDEPLVESPQSLPNDWWQDYLLYYRRLPSTKGDLWIRDMRTAKDYSVVATAADEIRGRFSPDGRSIAYVSDETRKNEIWIAPVAASANGQLAVAGGKRKLSNNGGTAVRWRRDGKELYYLSSDGMLMAVDITRASTFPFGAPRPLFQTPIGAYEWDVAPDGQRFLILAASSESKAPLTAVTNWTSLLKN